MHGDPFPSDLSTISCTMWPHLHRVIHNTVCSTCTHACKSDRQELESFKLQQLLMIFITAVNDIHDWCNRLSSCLTQAYSHCSTWLTVAALLKLTVQFRFGLSATFQLLLRFQGSYTRWLIQMVTAALRCQNLSKYMSALHMLMTQSART